MLIHKHNNTYLNCSFNGIQRAIRHKRTRNVLVINRNVFLNLETLFKQFDTTRNYRWVQNPELITDNSADVKDVFVFDDFTRIERDKQRQILDTLYNNLRLRKKVIVIVNGNYDTMNEYINGHNASLFLLFDCVRQIG